MSPRPSTHKDSLPCIALNLASAGEAPQWIELIPAGAEVQGRDGRAWKNPDPAAVVAASDPSTNPIPLDWEHATQVKAVNGDEAPAAGWIEQLDVRDGAIWGRVDWTRRGAEQVANREYRFVSPVFGFDKLTRQIKQLICVGLTNTPNLLLTALNREGQLHSETSENHLTLAARLQAALGLPADATEDVIVSAATTAHAANKAGVDLTRYAPRTELETAVNARQTAEAKLTERETADTAKAITAALDQAQAEGKITPASRGDYEAMCKAEGGLDRFTSLVKTLPKLTGAQATQAANKPGATTETGVDGLTPEDLAMCRATGKDPVEFAKAKKEG